MTTNAIKLGPKGELRKLRRPLFIAHDCSLDIYGIYMIKWRMTRVE